MQNFTLEPQYLLPLNYNDNKIVLLTIDPYNLFCYWEIANEKKQNFINQFGQNSWDFSNLILKLNNITLDTKEFIEINDEANNWYIKSKQPNCTYNIEIGKLLNNEFFINFATSNYMKTPRDKVSENTSVFFTNFKNPSNFEKFSIQDTYIKYENHSNNLGISSASISGVSSESFIN